MMPKVGGVNKYGLKAQSSFDLKQPLLAHNDVLPEEEAGQPSLAACVRRRNQDLAEVPEELGVTSLQPCLINRSPR